MKTLQLAPSNIETVAVDTLKDHPLNAKIYDDTPINDTSPFYLSIRDQGLLEPIVVLSTGFVVSGHRRLKVALMLEYTHVDCNVRHDLGESHQSAGVTAALILYNTGRVKTTKELEKELFYLAKANSALNVSRADSAKQIADQLDVGERTARNMVDAVEEADDARERGDDDIADAIENAEGTRERNEAVAKAKRKKKPAKRENEVALIKHLRALVEKTSRAIDKPAVMANSREEGTGNEFQQTLVAKLQGVIGTLNRWLEDAGGEP